jgi:hypothetical protein
MSRYRVGLLIAVLMLLFTLAAGCAPLQDFDRHLQTITDPYRFQLAKWEFKALGGEIGEFFSGRHESTDNVTSEVVRYFDNVGQIQALESEIEAVKAGDQPGDLAALGDELGRLRQENAEVDDSVARHLETQIRETLSQQGIYNPADKYIRLKVGFPPVSFKLDNPPYMLVVSPRDRIESIREITLLPELGVKDMENIEAQVDKLGFSSLVVGLGGLSTYPSYVTDEADLQFIIETAVHEWLHQYLAFTPLGFRYMLDLAGIQRDYDIATINETVVSMVSKEIGGMIYKEHYALDEKDSAGLNAAESGFNFNREMREIRKAVDDYLAKGKIEQAEQFMEQKRQYLADNSYYIRKLNQAYFAFYGTYADSPTSISPIGVELKKLRSQSVSLKEFLETVMSMTSGQELAESASGNSTAAGLP